MASKTTPPRPKTAKGRERVVYEIVDWPGVRFADKRSMERASETFARVGRLERVVAEAAALRERVADLERDYRKTQGELLARAEAAEKRVAYLEEGCANLTSANMESGQEVFKLKKLIGSIGDEEHRVKRLARELEARCRSLEEALRLCKRHIVEGGTNLKGTHAAIMIPEIVDKALAAPEPGLAAGPREEEEEEEEPGLFAGHICKTHGEYWTDDGPTCPRCVEGLNRDAEEKAALGAEPPEPRGLTPLQQRIVEAGPQPLTDAERKWAEQVADDLEKRDPKYEPAEPPKTEGPKCECGCVLFHHIGKSGPCHCRKCGRTSDGKPLCPSWRPTPEPASPEPEGDGGAFEARSDVEGMFYRECGNDMRRIEFDQALDTAIVVAVAEEREACERTLLDLAATARSLAGGAPSTSANAYEDGAAMIRARRRALKRGPK